MSFRVTPEFKQFLELAARLEKRSRTNMLEVLLLDYCRVNGLVPPVTVPELQKPAGPDDSPPRLPRRRRKNANS
jgi:hypothetical protein